MVYLFIKDEHKVRNLWMPYEQEFFISDEINDWIYETYKKHGVNIYNFCYEWIQYFYDYTEIWPKGHKQKSKYYEKWKDYQDFRISDSLYWDYDYKQKNNLFGLDGLYRSMPKKSFAKGKKQEFEAVLLYCWLHSIERDDAYWNEYVESVL